MQLTFKSISIVLLISIGSKCYAQFNVDASAIDSLNKAVAVEPVEANFLFSYYEQDGTKSPVTGGIGNEELTDAVGSISLKIPLKPNLKLTFLGGLDVYSSASTDNINNEHGLYTESSASKSDARVYSNVGVILSNEKRRITYGGGVGFSNEWDVTSYNFNANFSKLTKNRNTLFSLKSSFYTDKWDLIFPSELRWKYDINQPTATNNNNGDDEDEGSGVSKNRNTYNGELTIKQDFTQRMKGSISIETSYQDGMLSTPFHRIYFSDTNTHDIEKLPTHRFKVPVGLRLNYFIAPYLIAKFYYRYYFDDFGIKAHTASIELPIKPNRSIAITPFYRYHTQTASDYFKPYGFHSVNDSYYTSDYDLANIESNRVGLELRYSPLLKSKDDNRKHLMFKKVTLRGSKYFKQRESELILKAYVVALELSFSIE